MTVTLEEVSKARVRKLIQGMDSSALATGNMEAKILADMEDATKRARRALGYEEKSLSGEETQNVLDWIMADTNKEQGC